MGKIRLLFAITQFFKGGAEIALLNLFHNLDKSRYDIDFVMLNQLDIPGTISLVDQVPSWVNVVDAVRLATGGAPAAEAPDPAPIKTVLRKAVGQKHYDWAFHIGEWSSPEFVAAGVWADHKAAWIHNDLNIAEYFDGDAWFKWNAWYECYLFVSARTLEQSAKKYPVLLGKSRCVHNLLDIPAILSLAAQPLGADERYFAQGLPVVVTCANVRLQKNHLRQAEAMALLKQEGFDFLWLNVGATPDAALAEALRQRIVELDLGDRFLLLGGRDNPYPYMARANAFALLSDYESWPMVLGETLLLGTPVVATKTSGALAQITPENGLLVDFTLEAITRGLRQILTKPPVLEPPNTAQTEQQGLAEFENLVRPLPSPRALYVADTANAPAFAQMATLAETYGLTASLPPQTPPDVLAQCPCPLLQTDAHRRLPWFYLDTKTVLDGPFSPAEKWTKRLQAAAVFFGFGAAVEKRAQAQALRAALEGFDAVFTQSPQGRDAFLARYPYMAPKTSVLPKD